MGIFDDQVVIEYTIHLSDQDEVTRLQAVVWPGRGGKAGDVWLAPDQASELYHAPIVPGFLPDGTPAHNPFGAPCITSPHFGGTFPNNKAIFEQGGWWLFGGHTYYWVGRFAYAPALVEGGVGAPGVYAIRPRRFVEGFETGIHLNSFAARVASRHIQGFGGMFDDGNGYLSKSEKTPYVPGGWQRFYLRVTRRPTASAHVWHVTGTPNNTSGGVGLALLPSGQLSLGSLSSTGTDGLFSTTPLPLHQWHRIDVVFRFDQPAGAVDRRAVQLWIDGVAVYQGSGVAGLLNASHTVSWVGASGATNGACYHIDDWVSAEPAYSPSGAVETPKGPDWTHGSRVALVGATGFGSDHQAAAWTGDWRATRAHPTSSVGGEPTLDTTLPGAKLTLATDADLEVDDAVNQVGVAALTVDIFNTNPGTLPEAGWVGYRLPSGPSSLVRTASASGAMFQAQHWWPGPADGLPLTPLRGLELLFVAGEAAGTTRVSALLAQVEVLGLFGPEDVPPGGAVPAELMPRGHVVGIHNAPYPRSAWAQATLPPLSPFATAAGSYTGTGTFVDLVFTAPVHFLVIRSMGNRAPVIWYPSQNGPHAGGAWAFHHRAPVQVLIDPGFVAPAGETITGRDLPATPATLAAAVPLANTLAYGSAKHSVGDAVWQNYLLDPLYYWKRMLGWQAGGADVAVYGPYAVPPKDWAASTGVPASEAGASTLVRIVGADLNSNAAGVVYQWVAVCDPGSRFLETGALWVAGGSTANDNTLQNEAFTPEAVFLHREYPATNTVSRGDFFKGLGHTGAKVTQGSTGTVIDGLTIARGTLTTAPALFQTGQTQIAYAAFRRAEVDPDGPGDKGVLQLASYVGDGAASRTITLAPATGRRPLFAVVIGQTGSAGLFRDPGHTGVTSGDLATGSLNTNSGITAGGLDQLTVGSALNGSGVTYEVFVLPGSVSTCNNGGWSCPGTFPIPPGAPGFPYPEPPLPPEPVDPEGPETPEPVDPTGPGGPGGGLPVTCAGAVALVINQALSAIGVSKQIATVDTELSPEASQARLHYAADVDATLRDYPWAFATRYRTLTPVPQRVAGAPVVPVNGDWLYAYRLPADHLFARRLVNPARRREPDPAPIRFRLGGDGVGGLLYCDEPVVELEYTGRPVCAALEGDALFRAALVWRHAHSLAPALSRDEEKVQYCWGMYQAVLGQATRANAAEATQTKDGDASWIVGRSD